MDPPASFPKLTSVSHKPPCSTSLLEADPLSFFLICVQSSINPHKNRLCSPLTPCASLSSSKPRPKPRPCSFSSALPSSSPSSFPFQATMATNGNSSNLDHFVSNKSLASSPCSPELLPVDHSRRRGRNSARRPRAPKRAGRPSSLGHPRTSPTHQWLLLGSVKLIGPSIAADAAPPRHDSPSPVTWF